MHVAVGQEFPVFGSAYGALGAASPVKQARHRHGPPPDALQERPRHVVKRPFDQFLHRHSRIFDTSSSALCRRALQLAISSVARFTSAARLSTSIFFAAEAGEDFLDLGDRLGVGRFFFLCHISRGLTTVSHRALTVQP